MPAGSLHGLVLHTDDVDAEVAGLIGRGRRPVLKDAGLVTERKVGRQRLYSLQAGPLRELAGWLAPYERFWQDRIGALADLLDTQDDAGDDR